MTKISRASFNHLRPNTPLAPLSASPFRPHLQSTKDACDGLIKLIARWAVLSLYSYNKQNRQLDSSLSLAESNTKPFLLTFTRGEAASKAETFSANRDRENASRTRGRKRKVRSPSPWWSSHSCSSEDHTDTVQATKNNSFAPCAKGYNKRVDWDEIIRFGPRNKER